MPREMSETMLCREAIRALVECAVKNLPFDEARLRRQEVEAFRMHTQSTTVRRMCEKALGALSAGSESAQKIVDVPMTGKNGKKFQKSVVLYEL